MLQTKDKVLKGVRTIVTFQNRETDPYMKHARQGNVFVSSALLLIN